MTRLRSLGAAVAFAGTLLAAGFVGGLLLWTTFMVYDDEGYVLYSLKAFAEHGGLYEQVYSQYGPFFFELYRALHGLGFEFTNTAGRCVALACWVGAAAISGAIVWREAKARLPASVVTVLLAFGHLWSMVAEPSHPGGLIALLTACAAWVGTHPRWPDARRAVIIGALCAMLALTKVNTGAFLIASAGLWWLLTSPAGSNPWVRRAAITAAAAFPFAVMSGLIGTPWVRVFAFAIGGGAAATLIASRGLPTAPRSLRILASATAAAAVVTLGTALAVVAHGTTVAGLIEGVILGPLRHPSVYAAPFTWQPGTLALAIASAPLAWLLARMPPVRRAPYVIAGRIVLAAAYAACAGGAWSHDVRPFVLSYGVATAWIFVLPLRDDDPGLATRAWVALVLGFQAMHAYPVAGSQISWGTFLWVPLAALGIADLVALARSRIVRISAGAGALATAVLVIGTLGAIGWRNFSQSDPLRVPGASGLRPPASFASAIRMLVANTQVHADTLFTLPGMMSFNLWTDVPPPTIAHATHWFNLLSPSQQAAIQQRLAQSDRGVLIVQRNVYEFLIGQNVVTRTPLLEWLLANYRPVFAVESYEFWVRTDRTIAPIGAARTYQGVPGAATRHKIELVVALPERAEIAAVELHRFVGDGIEPVRTWTNRDAIFIRTPIAADGRTTGPSVESRLPFAAHGLFRLDLYTNDFPPGVPEKDAVIHLVDGSGRRLAEARFVQ